MHLKTYCNDAVQQFCFKSTLNNKRLTVQGDDS